MSDDLSPPYEVGKKYVFVQVDFSRPADAKTAQPHYRSWHPLDKFKSIQVMLAECVHGVPYGYQEAQDHTCFFRPVAGSMDYLPDILDWQTIWPAGTPDYTQDQAKRIIRPYPKEGVPGGAHVMSKFIPAIWENNPSGYMLPAEMYLTECVNTLRQFQTDMNNRERVIGGVSWHDLIALTHQHYWAMISAIQRVTPCEIHQIFKPQNPDEVKILIP